MIIINFIFVFIFAMFGELLRAKFFGFGKLMKKPLLAPKHKDKKVAEEKPKENETEGKTSEEIVFARYDKAKSEKVRDLLKKNYTLEQKKIEVETTRTESEQYNNQD